MIPVEVDTSWLMAAGGLFVIVMLRANGTYWLGRLAARGARATRARRIMESPGYARAEERLNRWGAPLVTASFFTIGVQTLVNLAAGAIRMPLRRYLPAMTIGCVCWALIYSTVGFVGFEALGLLWQRSPALAIALGAGLVAVLTAFVVWRMRETRAGRSLAATQWEPVDQAADAVLTPKVAPTD